MTGQVSCPECGSYAVTVTQAEGDNAEYRCDDCGHYFVDAAPEEPK